MASDRRSRGRAAGGERPPGTYGVGSRLKKPPSPELIEFFQETYLAGVDEHSFEASVQVSLAHVVMLAEEGIIPFEDAGAILVELLEMGASGLSGFPIDSGLGDLLPNMETQLIARIGEEVGGRFHTGRSRGDYYVTISRLKFRRRTLELLEEVIQFRRALLSLAGGHLKTLMPGYTHMQHAQPVTLAHYLAGFVHEFERDFDRLWAALARINVSPMGLGILSTTSFALNRGRTATLLGFEGLLRNGRDLSDRDYVIESAASAAILMTHLHKLVTDLYEWSTSEFALVRVADEDSMTSSMMPQKSNPVVLEDARARTGLVQGSLMAVLSILKGSAANNVEVTVADTPGLRALTDAAHALRAFRTVLGRVQFDRKRMARLAGEHWSQATDIADLLVRETGISFRQAHRVTGTLVAEALSAGVAPLAVTSRMLDAAAIQAIGRPLRLPAARLRQALDPWQGVLHRRLVGGPAPEAMEPVLKDSRDLLASDASKLEELLAGLDARRRELYEAARAMASGASVSADPPS
ncbi:MAG: argininosuccinate lyase [Candidatus Nephthysia bennettiae]|uniref:Argininosuccinate lyase n=1 Tax=Candidatus Nephthysia bennettiae TaxID=3127016 RepID=A0A934K545_9BACT|nr:argininosuccinate lyase [Candidatus Dormibacteraeota bacterium]MBJ7612376.1 argininosuccinate lyase [Candidatus Dormibacteraeota bacterium]PZR88446.1 MAG: argininosuccinate lyase [Candidatus Dormibacteraeota bacterium]